MALAVGAMIGKVMVWTSTSSENAWASARVQVSASMPIARLEQTVIRG